MKTIIIAAALCVVGCSHNNHSAPPVYYKVPSYLNPPPSYPSSTLPAKTTFQYPCGQEMDVHVESADVNLPKLDVVIGMEGKIDTEGYVLHLKNAVFHKRSFCQHEVVNGSVPTNPY